MKVNDTQDYFTDSIARKVAIKFTKQSKPLLGLKGFTMTDGLNKNVRKSKRWLNIQSDETLKCKLAISVTYSNGRYYVFYSVADSTYSSGFMSMEDADIMYIEVLSLLEQAGEDVYNTFVTEL
jgi:hypothetical protein